MNTEQQTKFIELRAKGFSLAQIATELNVCKRTLVNWGHKLGNQIHAQYALEQEALREQLIGFREQRLRRQGELLAQVEAELEKRSLADLSTARLFTLAESLRRQILKETSSKLPPSPPLEDEGSKGEEAHHVATRVDAHQPSTKHNQPTQPQPAQRASMPLNSQPETINAPLPEDRCKNGATSVQPCNDLIPSPLSEAEG